jgi:hypothetical protein
MWYYKFFLEEIQNVTAIECKIAVKKKLGGIFRN